MKLTVVIVTRNRREALATCLESVLRQSVPQVDVLVVDNDSTDGTGEMLAQRFPMVKIWRSGSNLGAAGGRNAGIEAASGEVCLCIDDDAILLGKDAIARCMRYFEQDPGLCALGFRIVSPQGNVITKLIPRRDRRIVTEDTPAANFSGTGFAVRREQFLALGGFWDALNPYFGEEPEFCYRLMEQGGRILLTPHIEVQHEESPNERPPDRRLYCGTRNAPWIAWRNLPWPAATSLTILSLGYFFLIACRYGQMGSYISALAASARGMPRVLRMRRAISAETARNVSRYSGLLYY